MSVGRAIAAGRSLLLLAVARVGVAVAAVCEHPRWKELHEVLSDAELHAEEYGELVPQRLVDLTDGLKFDWFRDRYQDCVEGLLSLVLYLALHDYNRRAALIELADQAARELNPLALQSGLNSWPLFGVVGDLGLLWQGGGKVAPLATEPWRLAPCTERPPGVIAPLLSAFSVGQDQSLSPLQLVRGLDPGALLVDAGVFDGTDWTLHGVLAGATVLGFEPVSRNLELFKARFPGRLGEALPDVEVAADASSGSSKACQLHTMLPVAPGEAVPRVAWADVFPPRATADGSTKRCAPTAGHAYIIGAALGEQVRALNMTARYDYSSVYDQAYMRGPPDQHYDRVAMTTLDRVFAELLAPAQSLIGQEMRTTIDILKVDVEGYEMGALRGAERLLSEGRVRYLAMEFHPGMLGSTGTDPQGLLEFLQHYCFSCQSFKIDRPLSFADFVARYTASVEALPVQGLGKLEDLLCVNSWWRGELPPLPRQPPVDTSWTWDEAGNGGMVMPSS